MENEKSLSEQAISAIMFCAAEYKVKFAIQYGSDSPGESTKWRRLDGSSMWRIEVMTKRFVDIDFVQCAKEACKFVMNAHEENKID